MSEQRWQLRRGRMLQWAPAWTDSDAALVFDAASGDYWVLSEAAAGLLRGLADTEVAAGPDRADDATATPEAELLLELQRHGLVSPVG